MEASFDTCGQLWISANRNWVNSANCITLSAAHSDFSESSFRASGTSALKSMLHCWKPEKELRFASAYISWCTVLKWGIGGYYENMHDNENIFKSWVHTDDLERSWAMKIFPPMQFLSHLSCFMARKPTRGHKCIPTSTGASGGGGKDHLVYLPSNDSLLP